MSRKIVIIGAGGVGREIAATLMHKDFEDIQVTGFIDDNKQQGTVINNLTVLGDLDWLITASGNYEIVLAIGNPQLRKKIIERLGNDFSYPTIIHPNVSIHNEGTVNIGYGCYIGDGCIFTTDIIIEDSCFINTGCSLQHDTVIKVNSVLMPGVRITAGATIGRNCFVATNCVISKTIEIEDNTVITESIR